MIVQIKGKKFTYFATAHDKAAAAGAAAPATAAPVAAPEKK